MHAESGALENGNRLVAFSGMDGAGKSTQIDLLVRRLDKHGCKVVRFWSRGGYTPGMIALKHLARTLCPGRLPPAGPSASRTRAMESSPTRKLWLCLAILDLLFWYAVWLRVKRLCGYWVILDRYLDDTALDFRLNFPRERVMEWRLWRMTVRLAPRPHAAFLLLLPVEESERRSALKHEPFPDPPQRLRERLEHYSRLAGTGRWKHVDGCRPAADIHRDVCLTCGLPPPPA